MTELLPRHEWWRRAYRSERYMIGLSDEELELRFADVMTNQVLLTEEGKLGISGATWAEKFTHIAEELAYRGRGFPSVADLGPRFAVPRPGVSKLGAAVRAEVGGPVPRKFTLFKYGKIEHLRPLHSKGLLRLRPASSYDDPSLNAAIADKELSFQRIRGHVRTQYTQLTDYYCFCSSWLHFDRLIADFDATAVLVINDPNEFIMRLVRTLNPADFQVLWNRVTYVDPLLLDDHELKDLRFVKHMRHTYQAEHRWVASPPTGPRQLGVVEIAMGSIEDISTLHVA